MGTISTVTIGSDTFSVYNLDSGVVTDNFTSFWNGRLGEAATAVAAASADDKNRALVMACDWIDRATNFSGTKTVSTQPRSWPRDNATCDGTAITDGTTPDDIANASFALAGLITVDPEIVNAASQGSNVKRAKAGTAEVEFFTPTIGTSSDIRLPVTTHDVLKCYFGSGTAASSGLPAQFGADSSGSGFSDTDYELDEGFA